MTAPQGDPFKVATPSQFPKIDDFENLTVLIEPSVIEQVPPYDKSKPGLVDRATADVTVFGPTGEETIEDMYLSQGSLVTACKKALKPGGQPVLGVVKKVGSRDARKIFEFGGSPEDYAEAYEKWFTNDGKGGRPKGEAPKFAWILATPDEQQQARALAWWNERDAARKAAAAAKAAPANPFATAE